MYCIVLYGIDVELTTTICWDDGSAQLPLTNTSTTTNASTTLTSSSSTTTTTKHIIIKHDNQTCTE